ncbi:hypothetical protein V8J82_14625 [Gymnodinialimonas sp. 2305UL16-5]|uniref:hypothetical protein n=1 Tax=Gymnodinialimonas mytili TaxID=3126503 RepID=UPI0030980559
MSLPRLALATCLFAATAAQAEIKGVPADMPCQTIDDAFQICGAETIFAESLFEGLDAIDAVFNTSDGLQAIAIVEQAEDGSDLSISTLQQDALGVLAEAAGVDVTEIAVIERSAHLLEGASHPTLVYRSVVDDVSYVYSNTIVVTDDTIAQFITAEPGAAVLSATHRTTHTRFLAQIEHLN